MERGSGESVVSVGEVPLSSAPAGADAVNPERSKLFQKTSSFFSRSPSGDGSAAAPAQPKLSISSWAKNLKLPVPPVKDSNAGTQDPKPGFSIFRRSPGKIPMVDEDVAAAQATSSQEGAFGTFTRGFLDTSRNAVKVVQTRARHLVSQNKRRYQEGGFDLDMTYITESIIAMGFPAGDMSSGILGYVEGFYRNHMEEVIRFFETHHKDKYKVYNLCSERLYDASLLEGKVASFPFDDHNCPPLQLVLAFCRSAYSWLKDDLDNVVVVHCKAGKARTGLMISCLLLYLKFFPTAEECIANYNERRCVDGKGLILPSQIRYVKYFERVLNDFNGETPTGRMCILRGIRLHRCPYWIRPAISVYDHNGILFSTKKHPRTKDMMPEDFWFSAPRKGIMVFALPGERCVADLNGDFKILFHDRQGDFYCWLNTNLMETRQVLNTSDLDGFDKRRLPSPGFQVEVVILDQTPNAPETPPPQAPAAAPVVEQASPANGPTVDTRSENDDVFSDNEEDDNNASKTRGAAHKKDPSPPETPAAAAAAGVGAAGFETKNDSTTSASKSSPAAAATGKEEGGDYVHVKEKGIEQAPGNKADGSEELNDFRKIAADASVFSFGDDEDDYDL